MGEDDENDTEEEDRRTPQQERPNAQTDVEKGTGVINSRVSCADGNKELEAQRRSVPRGGRYGSELRSQQIFTLLGLESSLRPRGR